MSPARPIKAECQLMIELRGFEPNYPFHQLLSLLKEIRNTDKTKQLNVLTSKEKRFALEKRSNNSIV